MSASTTTSFVPARDHLRQIERRMLLLVRRMGVRDSLTMRELLACYCEFTGAKIVMQERVLPVDCFFALTIKLADPPNSYVIAYQRETPAWHQDHGIGHELGHIICGHYENGSTGGHFEIDPRQEWEAEYSAALLQRWSYAVARTRGRQRALRPRQPLVDASMPLQERVGWL